MSHIPARLRRLVIERAGNSCEYCGLAQTDQAATFHIDHLNPVAAGGLTDGSNLALACVASSLYKSARLTAQDPQTGLDAPLFHPRQQVWQQHFRWESVYIIGTTPIGHATVIALKMNRPLHTYHSLRGGRIGAPSSLESITFIIDTEYAFGQSPETFTLRAITS